MDVTQQQGDLCEYHILYFISNLGSHSNRCRNRTKVQHACHPFVDEDVVGKNLDV
jgi:hypothetical protein